MQESLLYKKITRTILYFLGFLFSLCIILSMIAAYGRYKFFGKNVGDTKCFEETKFVKSYINGELDSFAYLTDVNRDYESSKPDTYNMTVIDFQKDQWKDFSNKDTIEALDFTRYEGDTMENIVSQIMTTDSYTDGRSNYHEVFNPYNNKYSFYSLSGKTNTFLRISIEDYTQLINEICVPISSTSDYAYNYMISRFGVSAANIDRDSDAVYGIHDQKVVYFNPTDYSFYNPAIGYTWYVEFMNPDSYLYIPITAIPVENIDKIDNLNNLELGWSIITAPFFYSMPEAFLASLTSTQMQLLISVSNARAGIFTSNYYIKPYSGQEISKVEGLNGTPAEEVMKDKIMQNTDIVFYCDQFDDNIIAVRKNKKGEWVDYPIKNSELENVLKRITEKADFCIGIKLSDYSNEMEFAQVLYKFCRMISQPVSVFIISGFLFVIVLIMLSIATGVVFKEDGSRYIKLGFIEKIPYEIVLGVDIALFVFGYLFLAVGLFELGIFIPPSGTLDYDNPSTGLALMILAFGIYTIFMESFLSLIRRIKAGVFLKRLLVTVILKWIRGKLIKLTNRSKGHTVALIKSILLAAVNLLVILVFYLIGENLSSRISVLLILGITALDIVAIYRVMSYTRQIDKLLSVSQMIKSGDLNAKVNTEELYGSCRLLGELLNGLGESIHQSVVDSTRNERFKAELITNVSHDIKTPLTSIISYVDILKHLDIEDERVREYIDILDIKANRLKQLILDLIEASKASTGNIDLECTNLDFTELLNQSIGEFEEKFEDNGLELVVNVPEENAIIFADGRRIFRIVENLFQNACKYAMSGTRVYLKLEMSESNVVLSLKNVSREMLNISADELTERFVRGDKSRYTEGSGLGLSIAKNLTELQGGTFEIKIDGDFFKANVSFPRIIPETPELTEEETSEEPVQEDVVDEK